MRYPQVHANRYNLWSWMVGLGAFLWVLLRSGVNPRRLTYPCQRAAMPIAASWLLATIAFFTASLFARRFLKISAAVITVVGIGWLVVSVADFGQSESTRLSSLPTWRVPDPVSTVFVMDSIPPTTGSLAAGDESVPDEYLPDPAMDTLVMMLEKGGIHLYRTAEHPDGIVGSDNVVIIKANLQWTSWNTTSTDRIKGLIWQILNHPDGFTGEIVICDNTQDLGTGINFSDNNSEDIEQSIPSVVGTFYAKGYEVYYMDWVAYWSTVATEYSEGDYSSGYVYESDTKVTYPKFRSPSFNYYVSLKYGIWDDVSETYDSSRLCIIDFPVLKDHGWAGATVAVKNWIGVLTTAYSAQRYGGFNEMHEDYFFGEYALVARVMAATYPRLTIVDAAWTTRNGPVSLSEVTNTKMLVASTDPVASSWYAAKFILTPIATYPYRTDPDLPGSPYHINLNAWKTFLADSAGYPCATDSSRIQVHDRSILSPLFTRITEGPHVNNTWRSSGVCFVDYNEDGYPDLYVTNAHYPEMEDNCLYENNGDGTFSQIDNLAIVNDDNFSTCAGWADYDNDGDLDLFVAAHRTHPNIFYVNDGAGNFTMNTTAPLDKDTVGSTTTSWIDYDLDGYLDLFVGNSTGPMSGSYPPYRNFLYHNDSGTFAEITTGDIVTREKHTYGASWCDYDNDGDPDLVTPNSVDEYTDLYRNDGDGIFTHMSSSDVCQSIANGVGSSWGDYDNDGDMDLFIGSFSPGPSYLYQNNGDGTFSKVSGHGLGIYLGRASAGVWADFDNDGDLDIYVWLAWYPDPSLSHGYLFENLGNGTFARITEGVIADDTCATRSAVWGDYDRDGDMDLYLANFDPMNDSNPDYLRNELFQNNGNDNGWITIKPVATTSNASAIGTKVRLKATINGSPVWQMRELMTQTALNAQPPMELHFGLGDASLIDSIKVEWPSGLVQVLTDVAVNQFLTVTEPLCGDADGSGGVNILDVTYIINYLYKDGPAPVPEEIADADGSGTLNILDVTHIINYLYKDGPEPIC